MGSFRHFRYGSGELYEKLSEISSRIAALEQETKLLQKQITYSMQTRMIEFETGGGTTLEMVYSKLDKMETMQALESIRSWSVFFSAIMVAFIGLSFAVDELRLFYVVVAAISFLLALSLTVVHTVLSRAVRREEEWNAV